MITIKRIFTALFWVFCFISCNNNIKQSKPTDSPTNGTINISVDESFRPVIDAEINVYESSYPGTKIIAHYKSEADCFKDLHKDSSNRMIIVTRGLNTKEDKFYNDSLAYTPVSDRVAWDAIAIVVNKNCNDTLFTMEGLQKILSGEADRSKTLVFDGLNATSNVRFVMDSVLRGKKFDTSLVKAVTSSNDVLNYVANNINAMGFVGVSWIGNPEEPTQVAMLKKVKLAYVQCAKCQGSPFVKPTQASMLSRRYPLARGLYYILKENYSGLGSGFASFLKYERGQLIFRRSYLAPVMDFDIRTVNINETLKKD